MINVNEDGTVDIQLDAGEIVREINPDVLDAEEDEIDIGSRIFVNGEDIEWEEDDDDDDEDGEDGPYEEDYDDEEEGESMGGVIESFNEDGTANIRLDNGELLEGVDLDDIMPADGSDPSQMGEGSEVTVNIEGDQGGEGEGEGEGGGQGRGQGRGKQGRG
eukprot:COSAG05_NODE_9272_length_635_cov_1.115672_1_plen_160_part_10